MLSWEGQRSPPSPLRDDVQRSPPPPADPHSGRKGGQRTGEGMKPEPPWGRDAGRLCQSRPPPWAALRWPFWITHTVQGGGGAWVGGSW